MTTYIKIMLVIAIIGIGAMFASEVSAEDSTDIAVAELTFSKLEQYFDSAKEVLQQYEGDVTAVGLTALRIDAAQQLVTPLLLTIVLLCMLKMMIKFFKVTVAGCEEYPNSAWPFAFFLHVIYVVVFIIAIKHLLNIWAWTGIFYPEVYAVYKLVLQ